MALRFKSKGTEISETDNGGPISVKKLDANLKNAQLSTGPKTEAGKKHSSLNALKHGLLASTVLITKGDPEDGAQFAELLPLSIMTPSRLAGLRK